MAREWHGRRERRRSHLAATAPSSAKGRGSSSVTTASWAEPGWLAAAGRDANLVYGPAPWLALVPSSRERLGKGQGLHTCNDRCQVRQSPRSWCISSSHCKGACHEARLVGLRTC